MEKESKTFIERTKSTSISDVDFLFYLNLSILQGEYIFNRSFLRNKSELISSTKKEIIDNAATEGSKKLNTQQSVQSNLKKSLLNRQYVNDMYNDFSAKINENLNFLCAGNSYSQIDVDILRLSSLHRILDGDIFNEQHDKNIEDDEIRNLRNLFFLNLFIADYDENLESDKTYEKELKEIIKFLDNIPRIDNKANKIIKILLDKTKYLLFKIRYRSKPYRELKYDSDIGLLTNNGLALSSKHDLYISKDNVFFEFTKKTIDHYEKEKIKEGEEEKLLEEIEEHKMRQYFLFIKNQFYETDLTQHNISYFFEYNRYLKKVKMDCSKKIEKLEKIVEEVASRIVNIELIGDKFEELSYKSCKNLLHNTKFRLYLAQKEKSLIAGEVLFDDSFYRDSDTTKVIDFFEQIRVEREKIPKYFDYKQFEVQMLFFDHLILMDQKRILERFPFLNAANIDVQDDIAKYDVFIENIDKKIDIIHIIYKEFLDRFSCWDLESRDLGLLPIYLGKEDCMIPHKIQTSEDEKEITIDINLFLDSSYVLPVDYSRINEKKAEEKLQIDSKIQVIKSRIEALYNYKKSKIAAENITKQMQVFRKETESKTDEFKEKIEAGESNLKKKIKDGEFKTIQTVALFVTIASFVLMQVKIYDNKSGIESIAITFSLAGILVLFNGIFHWMIESQKEDGNKNIFCKLYSLITTPVIFVSLLLLGTGVSFFFLTKIKGWDMDSEKNKMLEEKVTVLKETQKMSLNLKEDSMRITELKKEIDLLKKRNK